MLLVKFVVLLLLGFVIVSLFTGLYFLVKDKGQTNRTVNALSVRIGLSIVAIIVILIAGATGVIQLNPSPLSSRASIQQAPEKVDQTTVEPVKPRAGGGRRPIENES